MKNTVAIRQYLKVADPKLEPILHFIGGRDIIRSRTPFMDLTETIINQQLSEKVGRTIFIRFRSIFPNKRVTPSRLFTVPDQRIRDAGISGAKTIYLKSLAADVLDKKLILSKLATQTDDDVITNLTRVKGIGQWTAEMFLMFSLGREDIFSYGDLGLKRAIQLLYALNKEPSVKQMGQLSSKWKPYRTHVALALWSFKDQ